MAINYDTPYQPAAVVALYDSLAPHWKKPIGSVPGLDAEKLLGTLERLQAAAVDGAKSVDLDVQALLALCRAVHPSWFTEQQFASIKTWLDAVADVDGNNWQETFGTDDDVAAALMKALKVPSRDKVNIVRDDDGIYVEYKDGDYGGASGRHNGKLVISDDSVCIYNEKKPGVKIQWGGELPSTAAELRDILGKDDWNEVADDDDDDDDDE
eukprot:TRINITY_DN18471_c1_g3_i2.p1 TRINITY_DN18471_c1_g3~~TRINITY_DN18471_c1_g3_i2.p1  ORF type:complete len:211 (+),score=107.24 TRINITY_DN18471_c1_g3_i2:105-737(+)